MLNKCYTCVNGILPYFASLKKPTKNIFIFAKFCIKVYFLSLFQIKLNYKMRDSPKNFFDVIQHVISRSIYDNNDNKCAKNKSFLNILKILFLLWFVI